MRTLTDSLIDVLRSGGLRVGDADGEGLTAPYVVVYPTVQARDGSLCDPFSDVDKQYLGRCYGLDRSGAEWVADRWEQILADSDLTVTELIRSDAVREDDTAAPPLFFVAVRARIRAYA